MGDLEMVLVSAGGVKRMQTRTQGVEPVKKKTV